MENLQEEKYRVAVFLTIGEKKALKQLARRDGRSMASYMRFLLMSDIEEYAELD